MTCEAATWLPQPQVFVPFLHTHYAGSLEKTIMWCIGRDSKLLSHHLLLHCHFLLYLLNFSYCAAQTLFYITVHAAALQNFTT
jgi:hypothetical protein